MEKKNIGVDAALQKIKYYCSYQERCHTEVKQKLYSMGLYKHQVEELLSAVIAENFLNEERFAIMYAGGKFRMNQWGRNKIRQELKQKGVSSYCIKKALEQIPEEEYRDTLTKLIEKKEKTLKGKSQLNKLKVRNYLLQKGFEPEEIYQHLKSANSEE